MNKNTTNKNWWNDSITDIFFIQ